MPMDLIRDDDLDAPEQDTEWKGEEISPTQADMLSSIRRTLANTSIGTFLNTYNTSLHQAVRNTFDGIAPDVLHVIPANLDIHAEEVLSTLTDRSTPASEARRTLSFTDAKRVFSNISTSRRTSRSNSNASATTIPSPLVVAKAVFSRARAHTISTIPVFGSTGLACSVSAVDSTPPLTPDSLASPSSALDAYPHDAAERSRDHRCHIVGLFVCREDELPRTRKESEQIKEGKKPDRSISKETLAKCNSALMTEVTDATRATTEDTANLDNEWVGMEYSLELSLRDRRPTDSEADEGGECSKSHESWSAMHLGRIDPLYEDQEYLRWRKWHRRLDRQEAERKAQRMKSFIANVQEWAEVYAEEMRLRQILEWRKADVEVTSHSQYIKKEIAALAIYRSDSFYPRVKHNLAWVLKKSRSVACLRELHPIPEP